VLAAIFTRFGTLIVKMMVDIGNIAINTIVGDNTDLIVKSTWPLVKDALFSAGTAMGSMAAYAGALAIPYLNLAAVGVGVASIGSVAAALVTNNINAVALTVVNFLVKWIFEIVACYALSGVYITFILLFLSRVFMISILTVISPLAIMAYALPQTRKFFNQWWSALFKWTFLGVWTLFFLMLGIGSAGFIMPTQAQGITGTLNDGIFSQVVMDSGILYYLFLIVYLALVQDMASKESGGAASLFKGAMIGGGAAVVTHAIKPAAGRAREYATDKNLAVQQKLANLKEGESLGLKDKLTMHMTGITTKALEEKQLDNYSSMFSGDHKKAAAGAETFSKSFSLSKLATGKGRAEFSNIDPMVDSGIADIGKTNTVESIIKEGPKASLMKAIWAMRNAKTEDLPDLINGLGPEKSGSYLNYAIKEGKLTPSQIQAIARNTNALAYSPELRKYFSDKDKDHSNFERVKSFMNLGNVISPQQKSDADNLVARIMNLKGATRTYDSFKKIDNGVFDNDENLKAMLISGEAEMFGYAARTSGVNNKKLREAAKLNFADLVRANPDMVDAIAKNLGAYGDIVPENIKTAAATQARDENPNLTGNALSEAINTAIKNNIEGMTRAARQQAQAAAQAAAQGRQQSI